MKFKTSNYFTQIVRYLIKTRWWFLGLLIIVFAILVYDLLGMTWVQEKRDKLWSPILEHYVAFGTFLVAFAAWFSTVKRDWRDTLPMRLSAYFVYNDKIIMQCNYAYLSGETDIRQMGQQIGAQIADSRFLTFTIANVTWKEIPIVFKREQVKHSPTALKPEQYPFRHYVVLYNLLERPEELKENTFYLWQPPFEDISPEENSKLLYSEKQTIIGTHRFDAELFWQHIKASGYCTNQHFIKDKNP